MMSYVAGIGDEVLLFFTFIIASSGTLLFLVLRESYRRTASSNERSNEATVTAAPIPSNNNDELLARYQDESRDEFQQDTPLTTPNNVNIEPVDLPEAPPEEVQSNDHPENQSESIAVRLVLQDQTINAEFSYTTTLQEVKR